MNPNNPSLKTHLFTSKQIAFSKLGKLRLACVQNVGDLTLLPTSADLLHFWKKLG